MTQSYSESLRGLFESNPFQAQSLMTPIEKMVSIEIDAPDNDVGIKIRTAQREHISSLIVSKNNKLIGYSVVPSSSRRLRNYDPRNKYVSFNDQHYLSFDCTLGDIVSKFGSVANSLHKTASPPIFLVYDDFGKRDAPVGLMTYWDLNRRSVYSYLYTIFVYFEQSIKLEIYRSHTGEFHNCIYEYIKRKDTNKSHPRTASSNANDLRSNISKLKFTELVELLYDKHSSAELHLTLPRDIIKALASKRNQLAHPVNLVMESGLVNVRNNLETLFKICVEAKDIVIKYDRNPKNTMYSSPMNELNLM